MREYVKVLSALTILLTGILTACDQSQTKHQEEAGTSEEQTIKSMRKADQPDYQEPENTEELTLEEALEQGWTKEEFYKRIQEQLYLKLELHELEINKLENDFGGVWRVNRMEGESLETPAMPEEFINEQISLMEFNIQSDQKITLKHFDPEQNEGRVEESYYIIEPEEKLLIYDEIMFNYVDHELHLEGLVDQDGNQYTIIYSKVDET